MDRKGVTAQDSRRAALLGAFAGVLVLALAAGFSGRALSQAAPGPGTIPEAAARKMVELGLKNIQRALCDGFNQCTPATPQELENPPISLDQARAAMVIGARSAFAVWCGFDADRRSVLPFLRQLRQSKLYGERELALMAVIHGIQQSITAEQLKGQGECQPTMRQMLDAQLPKT